MSNPNGSQYRNYSKSGNYQKYPQNASAPVPDFPDQYVDFAEKQMKEQYRKITTSKLRNLLGLLMDVYNTELLRTEQEICADSAVKLQMARIRIAYECGRDRNTKDFVTAMPSAALAEGHWQFPGTDDPIHSLSGGHRGLSSILRRKGELSDVHKSADSI